ncbi:MULTISPECIES: hypothetical protein [Leptospira]|uniref:hypothetical protein n=1 Tax=Leptospira TaxID=171 RepID=UPI000248B3C1|nr:MULTISPECIES: hypothetical protein [Leptospira]
MKEIFDSNYHSLGRFVSWEISRSKEYGTKHTGVILGENEFGQIMVIHNHPESNISIVSIDEFMDGRKYYSLRRPRLLLSQIKTNIKNAIVRNRRYDLLNYNCQHFSSSIVDGYEVSNDVRNWGAALLFLGLGYLATRE